MNILVALNDAYVAPLEVMLTSLFVTNKWCKIKVFLFYSNINESNINNIKKLIEHNGHSFEAIYVTANLFDNLPQIKRISNETYYRLLCAELLPKNINKVLYLDADIIIKESLKELYRSNMDGFYFFAARDENIDVKNYKIHKKLNIPLDKPYVNAGVLLINLKLFRNEVKTEELLDFVRLNYKKLYFSDQDVINSLFYNKIKVISLVYNCKSCLVDDSLIKYLLFIFNRKNKKDIKIIHYLADDKPWKKGFHSRHGKYFYKYAELSGNDEMTKFCNYNKYFWVYNYLYKKYIDKN